MTIYSLDILLSQFWTSPFYVLCLFLTVASWPAYRFVRRQVWKGGLVFPSLPEFSTVCCDPQAMVFPGVMYGCESRTIKKAECQKIDAFELWCWRRLLRVPWTVRRSNQSVWKEINSDYSLEGLMLKWSTNPLATGWEELTQWKRPWCW